ncbi:MAG: hypothetical protein AUG51_26715 [Acidobacteria bacterium 13_1_20CM_3_53_8]|nr:MAG: hypothetical protein AUG51_26715 [Acidobacteria bacterium 13_1_20CM_3_53_8]
MRREFPKRLSGAYMTKIAFIILVGLVCAFQFEGSALAQRVRNGRMEITTNPGAYPVVIDGQSNGETSTTGRIIELQPGAHTVEVVMPNGSRWIRQFTIVSGRKQCIVLNYAPTPITIAHSPCPYPVNVSAPAVVNEGDVITFASDVSYSGSSALNYTWTVSPASARIVSGAGTPTITVDTTGLGRQRVTSILVVDDGSGESACRQAAQASTNITPVAPPVRQPRRFDEFPALNYDDLKARLDNLAIQLQNEPDSTGYIIVYSGRASRAGQAERLGERARQYLTTQRNLDPGRLVIVNGGVRDTDTFEIWLVPQGAQPPQATPTAQPGTQPTEPEIRVRPRRRGR